MNTVTASAPHPAAMQCNHVPNGADSGNLNHVLRAREFDIRAHRKCVGATNRERFAWLVQQTPDFAPRIRQTTPDDRANPAALERCA